MKRMYVSLGIFLLVILWASTVLGQNPSTKSQRRGMTQEERMKRRMELREKMHQRMRERLFGGQGMSSDMFKDLEQMFEDTMSDSLFEMDSISAITGLEPQFQSEWTESKTGRTLILSPKKNQQLDIDVTAEMITIKGKTENKTPNGTSISNFTNSFPVPGDCDGSKVKITQKDEKLQVELPFKAGTVFVPEVKRPQATPPAPSQLPDDRKPIGPTEGDVEI